MTFSNILVSWYLQNKRDLPWRTTKNPYKIWLSEIILQQTRIDQGLAYYNTFVKEFPTVHDLASADQEKVLKLWQGLGYYSRARNLHTSAKYVVQELNGEFPKTYKELLKLKGVGDYTASAIASICYNEPTAVVDGNVYRVLARFFGNFTPINTANGAKEFKAIAQKMLLANDAGTYNQAIMEYGARMCKPQNPNCESCELQTQCSAFNNNTIKDLPVKIKKLKVKKRYFNFLVITTEEGKTVLEQREGKGIWQGLYQFPLVESSDLIDQKALVENGDFGKYVSETKKITLFNDTPIVHKLSHQHLYTRFWLVKTPKVSQKTTDWSNVKQFAVPVLIDNFLKTTELAKN